MQLDTFAAMHRQHPSLWMTLLVGPARQVISVVKVVLNQHPALKEHLVKVSTIKILLTVCLVLVDSTVLNLVSLLLVGSVRVATFAHQIKTRFPLLLSHMNAHLVTFVL